MSLIKRPILSWVFLNQQTILYPSTSNLALRRSSENKAYKTYQPQQLFIEHLHGTQPWLSISLVGPYNPTRQESYHFPNEECDVQRLNDFSSKWQARIWTQAHLIPKSVLSVRHRPRLHRTITSGSCLDHVTPKMDMRTEGKEVLNTETNTVLTQKPRLMWWPEC